MPHTCARRCARSQRQQTFLGYDYRAGCVDEEDDDCKDVMGIQKVEWVEDASLPVGQQGWPSIWTKLELTVDLPAEADGQPLSISFRNTWGGGTTAAFDLFSLRRTE